MVEHWDTRERWCAPWAQTQFCVGRVGTSFNESNNASVKVAWLSDPNEPLINLLDDLRRRNLEFIKQNRLSDAHTLIANHSLAFRVKPANRSALDQCQLAHTALATTRFKENLEKIHEYDVTVRSCVCLVFVCVCG